MTRKPQPQTADRIDWLAVLLETSCSTMDELKVIAADEQECLAKRQAARAIMAACSGGGKKYGRIGLTGKI